MTTPDGSSHPHVGRLELSGPWPVRRTPPLTPPPHSSPAAPPSWWGLWWPVVAQLLVLSLTVISAAAVIDHRTTLATQAAAADAGAGRHLDLPSRIGHAAAPVSVRIPRLKIASSLIDLRTDTRGALQPPHNPQQAGWYVRSSHPGDPGPTVLAGHVDSRTGPGVFYHLDHLRPGDIILIGRSDHTTIRFLVTRTLTVSKQHFPTALVYIGTHKPSLRLISCGGPFDRSTGHYLDNIIVLAVPAPTHRPLRRPTW